MKGINVLTTVGSPAPAPAYAYVYDCMILIQMALQAVVAIQF